MRTLQDKYIVKQGPSDKEIWWGDVNRPMKPEIFDKLYGLVTNHYNTNAKKMYVFDGYCGANLKTQKKGMCEAILCDLVLLNVPIA